MILGYLGLAVPMAMLSALTISLISLSAVVRLLISSDMAAAFAAMLVALSTMAFLFVWMLSRIVLMPSQAITVVHRLVLMSSMAARRLLAVSTKALRRCWLVLSMLFWRFVVC